MARTKKYFPHSIDAVMDTDFPNDVPVEEFMEMRVEYWAIPSSVACLIRTQNNKTGHVQEYSYQRMHAARKKILELCKNEDLEIIIVDDEALVGINKEFMNGRSQSHDVEDDESD